MEAKADLSSLKTATIIFITSILSIFVTLLFTGTRINEKHVAASKEIISKMRELEKRHTRIIEALHDKALDDQTKEFNSRTIPEMVAEAPAGGPDCKVVGNCITREEAKMLIFSALDRYKCEVGKVWGKRRERLDDMAGIYRNIINANADLSSLLNSVAQSQNALQRFVNNVADRVGLLSPVALNWESGMKDGEKKKGN